MSIILRDDRSFGGTAYPAGTTLSLDGALEANLVAQGLATWAGEAPYGGGPTHPAQLAVDDRGHITGLVGPGGEIPIGDISPSYTRETAWFSEWPAASAEWVYNSPAARDTTITFDGAATLKLPYNATPNTTRADWIPASDQPTVGPLLGCWVRNPTDHMLHIDVLVIISSGFANYMQQILGIPPTGGAWVQVWFQTHDGVKTGTGVYSSGSNWAAGATFGTLHTLRVRQSTVVTSGWGAGDYLNIGPVLSQPTKKRPKVLITFDDGKDSIYINRQWMIDRGLKGTCYIYPSAIGSSGYMTRDQLDVLYGLGWDIGDHSNTEFFITPTANAISASAAYAGGQLVLTSASGAPAPGLDGKLVTISGLSPNNYNGTKLIESVSGNDLNITHTDYGSPTGTATINMLHPHGGLVLLTEAEVLLSLTQSKEWLRNAGYLRSYEHHALPVSGINESVYQQLLAVGYKTARHTKPNNIGWFSQRVFNGAFDNASYYPTIAGDYTNDGLYNQAHSNILIFGGVASVEATANLSSIYAAIDLSIEYGLTLALLTHSLGTGDSAHHQAWMDYVSAKRDAGLCDVETISEWYRDSVVHAG